jgi:hypothetical protein
MSDTAQTKLRSQVQVQDKSETTVSAEIDKVIIGTIAAFAGLIGVWSVACLASAMFQAGGPLQLIGGWFRAVSGM